MKEILFKAQREDGNGFVEGFPVWDEFKNTLRIFEYINIMEEYGGNEIGATSIYHNVIPETVFQYTGKKDNKGNKIFKPLTVKF